MLADNLLIMMGICISWRNFEVLEHVKERGVSRLVEQRKALEETGAKGVSTVYSRNEFKVDLYSLTLGGSLVIAQHDRVSFILMICVVMFCPWCGASGRYVSLTNERVMAQETCHDPHSPSFQNRFESDHRFKPQQSHSGEGGQGRVLRVGYASYDWRDHPMGRCDLIWSDLMRCDSSSSDVICYDLGLPVSL